MKLKEEKAEFRKQFKEWITAQVEKGKYKNDTDACAKIAHSTLEVKSENTVRNMLYGLTYPIAAHHATKINKLTGIKLKVLNPTVWG